MLVLPVAHLLLSGASVAEDIPFAPDEYEALEGFIDIYSDEEQGRVLVRVDEFDEPFLYQASLPRGIGSNDLGLDRGQLGATKVVRFIRSGPNILLVEDNLQYRATSNNQEERQAIAESFARSVIYRNADSGRCAARNSHRFIFRVGC